MFKKFGEMVCLGCITLDDPLIIACLPQKCSHSFLCLGKRKIFHLFNINKICVNTILWNNVDKHESFGASKTIIFEIQKNICHYQLVKHSFQIVKMRLLAPIHTKIIQENLNKKSNVWLQHFVHELLKNSKGIAQPKKHDYIGKCTLWSGECCFQDIFLCDLDMVMTTIAIAKTI